MARPPPSPPLRRDDAFGSAAINSATFGLDQNLIAAMNGLFGPGEFSKAYQRELVKEQTRQAALRKAYPLTTGAGETVGTILPMLAGGEVIDAALNLPKVARLVKPVANIVKGAGDIFPKSGVLGLGTRLGSAAIRGGGAGGTMAAIQDVANGKWDFPDVGSGVAWGAGLGPVAETLAPVAGRVAGAVARPVIGAATRLTDKVAPVASQAFRGTLDYLNTLAAQMPGVDNPVIKRVAEMVKDSGHTPATVRAAVSDASQHGAPVTLAHVLSKEAVGDLASDASVSPAGRAALDTAQRGYDATAATAPARVTAHMDSQIAPGANNFDTVVAAHVKGAAKDKQIFEDGFYHPDGSHIMLSEDGEANKVLLNSDLEPFTKSAVGRANSAAELQRAQGVPVTGPQFQSHFRGPFSIKQAAEVQRDAAKEAQKFVESDPAKSKWFMDLHDAIGDGVEAEKPGYNAGVQVQNDNLKIAQLLQDGKGAFDAKPADVEAVMTDPNMTTMHQTAYKIGALQGLKDKVASGVKLPDITETLRAMGLQEPENLGNALEQEQAAATSPLPDNPEPPGKPGFHLSRHPEAMISSAVKAIFHEANQANESAVAARTVPLVTNNNPGVIQNVIDSISQYANLRPAQRAAQADIGRFVAGGAGQDEANYPDPQTVRVVGARPATAQELSQPNAIVYDTQR